MNKFKACLLLPYVFLSPNIPVHCHSVVTLADTGDIPGVNFNASFPPHPQPGGKDIPVTVHNLDDYLKVLHVQFTLVYGSVIGAYCKQNW